MGDRGSLEPATRDRVRPLAWALVVNMLSVHVVTVARTSGRCRPPGRRTLARRVTLAEYALRRTPTTTPAATLCPVQRPRLTFGARVGRRWAAVREPVLDTCVAALLWAGMAVDLATRPLTEGQSPTSPVAYVVTGLVAAPVVVHRRYPSSPCCSRLRHRSGTRWAGSPRTRVHDLRAGVPGGSARGSSPGAGCLPRRRRRS
jgi:hypothetical protein